MPEDNGAETYLLLTEGDDREFDTEEEATTYAEAIGLDDYDVVNDR